MEEACKDQVEVHVGNEIDQLWRFTLDVVELELAGCRINITLIVIIWEVKGYGKNSDRI